MAVIKAVSSKVSVGQALDYVMKQEKTESKLITGLGCEAETVKERADHTGASSQECNRACECYQGMERLRSPYSDSYRSGTHSQSYYCQQCELRGRTQVAME